MRRHRAFVLVALVAMASALVPVVVAGAGSGSGNASDTGMTSQRSSVTAAVRGKSVRATLHKEAPKPTAAQRRLLRQGMARSMSPGPDASIYQGPIAQGVGPGVTAPTAGSGKSPRTVTAFRDTLLPAGGLKSPVNEPSTDANGR